MSGIAGPGVADPDVVEEGAAPPAHSSYAYIKLQSEEPLEIETPGWTMADEEVDAFIERI